MPAQTGNNTDALDASVESTLHPSIHLSWRRNLLASPLLRLPTELILKIFAHVIELDDAGDDNSRRPCGWTLLILTTICRQLREIGTMSPQLWSSVDFTSLPIAELFLERCKYDPCTLIIKESGPRRPRAAHDPRRGAAWEKLEGRTFHNLRSLVFEGTEREFTLRVISVLHRAPNVSNLDLNNISYRPSQELSQLVSHPIPNLSTLRLHNFSIYWTSPHLRNLIRLTLGSDRDRFPPERAPIEMFLTALANCPNLEILDLTHTGPEALNGHQNKCDVVVQLCRLRELSLKFHNPSTVGRILSHIEYPESTRLAVYVPAGIYTDLSETISQVLPHRNVQAIQHFRNSTALTIYLDDHPQFFTDNLLVHFQKPYGQEPYFRSQRNPKNLARLASKIVEVIGGDTVISLNIEARGDGPPGGMWGALLHGLPWLERIRYHRKPGGGNQKFVHSFIPVFSRPSEGGSVCPWLQHLELPRALLTLDSAAILKLALTERNARGGRLKRIGISDDATEVYDRLVLEQFRDLVGEVE